MTNDTFDDSEPATVLVVEDEQSLADLYAVFLEPTYSVLSAYDGTKALETIHSEVDVVLLDRRMPGLAGEEVLERIRTEGYDCRVAMITAVPPDFDIIEMGFDAYLTKPVDRTVLLDTVQWLLDLRSYDELLQEYYRLVSKKVALEIEKDDVDLSQDTEFERLVDRVTDLEAELDENEAVATEADIRSLLD